jgi:hypothetical protein
MIQRIQSLHFFLTAIASVLFLSGKMIRFVNEAGGLLFVTASGLNKISAKGGTELLEKILPLLIILIIIASMALVTIFLFKNRKLQMKLSVVLIMLSVLLIFGIAYYMFAFSRNYGAEIELRLNLVLPVLILVCSIFAYRGIRKDQELIKSYDRLR